MALEKQEKNLPADTPMLKAEVASTVQRLRKELGAIATPNAINAGPPPSADRASDDFESGTLANWTTEVNGAGGWFVYTNGKTAPDPAQSDFNVPFDVPDPPQGRFAAVTDMNGPSRPILYRDVMLDGRYRLHLTVFYVNAGGFSTLQIDGTIGDNQQDRPRGTVSTAHLAGERPSARQHLPWCTRRSKPSQPKTVTFDLSPWQGQIVRLRFTVADNQGPLRAGVDDVRFERIEQ